MGVIAHETQTKGIMRLQSLYRTELFACLFVLFLSSWNAFAQQQDPTTMNGGSILAMAGKGAVAVAVDKRFGSGPQVWIGSISALTLLFLPLFTHLQYLLPFLSSKNKQKTIPDRWST